MPCATVLPENSKAWCSSTGVAILQYYSANPAAGLQPATVAPAVWSSIYVTGNYAAIIAVTSNPSHRHARNAEILMSCRLVTEHNE